MSVKESEKVIDISFSKMNKNSYLWRKFRNSPETQWARRQKKSIFRSIVWSMVARECGACAPRPTTGSSHRSLLFPVHVPSSLAVPNPSSYWLACCCFFSRLLWRVLPNGAGSEAAQRRQSMATNPQSAPRHIRAPPSSSFSWSRSPAARTVSHSAQFLTRQKKS